MIKEALVTSHPASRELLIKHCLIHSIVSAAPSFAMAILFGWSSFSQIAGLVAGVGLFVASAVVIHLTKPLCLIMQGQVSSRAFKWSKVIRFVHAILIWPCLFVPPLMTLALPDFWAGLLANTLTDWMGLSVARGPSGPYGPNTGGSALEQFIQTMTATFIEGWILAAAVGVLTLVLWVILRVAPALRR